ncbi:metallophosphoesterase family protein [Chlamydiota bacterium]
MKIGIISDTHIKSQQDQLPQAVYKIFKDVETIYHAGDLVDFSVIDKLQSIAPVIAVCGNMDSVEVKKKLPSLEWMSFYNHKIVLTHGGGPPWQLKKRIVEKLREKPDVVVFGHSHTPEVTKLNNIIFVNPGSPTDTVFFRTNSVALMTVTEKEVAAEIIYL